MSRWIRGSLEILAFVLINVGAFSETILGFNISTVLLFVGILAMFGFFTARGIDRGNQKFLAARDDHMLSLFVLGMGVAIMSSALIVGLIATSFYTTLLLEAGFAVYILGIIMWLVSLHIRSSSHTSPT